MTATLTLAVLSAAFLHALWNFIVRKGDNMAFGMAGVILGHVVFAISGMTYAGLPPWESWGFIIVSGVLHLMYQVFLLNAYRFGELTQVYPIARGFAPLIITALSIAVLSVELSILHLVGITIISGTIIGHGLDQYRHHRADVNSLILALLAGFCIACYSIVDGYGTRIAGSALSFYGASTIINAILFIPYLLVFEKGVIGQLYKPEGLKILLLGGAASYLAYVTVLWAVLSAPIAVVSSIRETSVLFALLLGTMVLKERLTLGKIIMTVLILAGIVTLKMA
jgi:uncharacterized membrane protein